MRPDRPVRITFLCHAATRAMREGRFPRFDDPLDPAWERRLAKVDYRPRGRMRCVTSPTGRAVATAQGLALAATTEPSLTDADPGTWTGLHAAAVTKDDPKTFALWLGDLDAAPPGGETLTAVLARVEAWLAAQPATGDVLAITHPAVIRAAVGLALGAPPSGLRQIDVAPLSLTRLTGQPRQWRVAYISVPMRHVASWDKRRRSVSAG